MGPLAGGYDPIGSRLRVYTLCTSHLPHLIKPHTISVEYIEAYYISAYRPVYALEYGSTEIEGHSSR